MLLKAPTPCPSVHPKYLPGHLGMTPPIPPGRAQPPSTLQSHKTPNGIKSASPVVGAIKRPHAVGVFLQDLSAVEIVAVHKGNVPSGRTDYALKWL